MKKILNVLLALSIIVSLNGCGLLNKIFHGHNEGTDVVGNEDQIMASMTHEYTRPQLDSMCVADTLPLNLNEWLWRSYTDNETHRKIYRYMYIKQLTENGELIYLVTPRGEMYIVMKRFTKTEE